MVYLPLCSFCFETFSSSSSDLIMLFPFHTYADKDDKVKIRDSEDYCPGVVEFTVTT